MIPSYLVPKLARETGVDKKARTFSPWSHLVSLICAQFPSAIGLNDTCDRLRLHSGLLVTVRGATAPSLLQRGVFWVTRAKDNMAAQVLHSLPVAGRILRDELIALRKRLAAGRLLAGIRSASSSRAIELLAKMDHMEVTPVVWTENATCWTLKQEGP